MPKKPCCTSNSNDDATAHLKAEVQRVTEENARLVRNLEAKVGELNLKLAEEKQRTDKLKGEIEKKESTSKDVSRKSLEAELQELKRQLFMEQGKSQMLDDENQGLKAEIQKLGELCDALSMKNNNFKWNSIKLAQLPTG